ncbi:MAG: fumarylacetoacetate hydrolase family protein [Gammaproteobacteria bacterium]|nr:fumarylacetoacetate hydrolase family protein [Gammaproteobacteria bacterium]
MQFASFLHAGVPGWGAVDGGGIRDCRAIAPTLRAALAAGTLPQSAADVAGAPLLPVAGLTLLPPVPDTGRIFCIGLNYVAHREETGRKPTDQPAIFVRFAASVVGHGQPLLLPRESNAYDFEGELAVIIGRPGRRIPEGRALEHVAGYACFMDGSLRDWQMHTHQYTPGKNFDRSGAFGPFLVSAGEVGDPNGDLKLVTRLNGQEVQSTTTDNMIFPVPALINYLSSFTQLEPGDLIATGTPGGVGFKRNPPLFMRAGDTIEVEIERVGLLANTVQKEQLE